MSIFYFDTSALVKRYIEEQGSEWVKEVFSSEDKHIILLSEITIIEFAAALGKRERLGEITKLERKRGLKFFSQHCASQYKFEPIHQGVIHHATLLVNAYPLRTNDAIQLATAIQLKHILVSIKSFIIFVSADEALNKIAMTEKLKIENPNNHV